MIIIGDVHGATSQYQKFVEDENFSIQLGDFGFKKEHDYFLKNIDNGNHKILFGNHDYYPYLNYNYSLGDYQYLEKYDLFCIRGAYSIDKNYRTLGLDWFPDEEIKYSLWDNIIKDFSDKKPNYVVSHDCPKSIRKLLFDITDYSLTSSGLEQCFLAHQPLLWIFGHHHKSIRKKIPGLRTTFICLNILEKYKL